MLTFVNLNRPRIIILVATFLYTILYWYIYANHLAATLANAQMLFYYPNTLQEDIFYVTLAMIPALWMPSHITKPSQYTNWILYITITIPTCIVTPHCLVSRMPMWPFVVAIVVCNLALLPVSSLKPLRLPRLSLSPLAFWILIAAFTVITFVALVAVYGPPSSGLSLNAAEQFRAAFKEKNKDAPMLVRYMTRWQANLVAPLFVGYGIVHRKYILIFLGCACEFGIFMLTTIREFFLTPMFLIAIGVWLYLYKKNNGAGLVTCLLGVCGALGAWIAASPKAIIPILFYDRFLTTGGQLGAYYYEFFTSHPPALMGASVGKYFVDSPYNLDLGRLIGSKYVTLGVTSDTSLNAVAHPWADAYGNFNFPGIFIVTVIMMITFWLMDSAYTRIDTRITIFLTVVVALSINAQGMQATMLSGGVVPMIVLGLMGARALKPFPDKVRKGRRKKEVAASQQLAPNA